MKIGEELICIKDFSQKLKRGNRYQILYIDMQYQRLYIKGEYESFWIAIIDIYGKYLKSEKDFRNDKIVSIFE